MGYIAGTMSTGEEILLTPKKHWWYYILAIIASFIAFYIILVISKYPNHEFNRYITETQLLFSLVIVLGFTFMEVLRIRSIEMACTNKRVIQKRGILKRNADELQVSKIEALEIKQSVWGRILGYGDVNFSGTGTSFATFKMVKQPLLVKSLAADILEKYK